MRRTFTSASVDRSPISSASVAEGLSPNLSFGFFKLVASKQKLSSIHEICLFSTKPCWTKLFSWSLEAWQKRPFNGASIVRQLSLVDMITRSRSKHHIHCTMVQCFLISAGWREKGQKVFWLFWICLHLTILEWRTNLAKKLRLTEIQTLKDWLATAWKNAQTDLRLLKLQRLLFDFHDLSVFANGWNL